MKEVLIKNQPFQQLTQDLAHLMNSAQLEAEKAVQQIRVRNYWKVGQQLDQTVPMGQAKLWLVALAQELSVESTLLKRCLQFFRCYASGLPEYEAFQKLSWAHHVELLPVSSEEVREIYIQQTQKQNWSRNQLRQALRQKLHQFEGSNADVQETKQSKQLQRPEAGLHTYVAKLERVVDGDTLLVRIDLGFDVWKMQRLRLRGIDCPELKTPEGKQAQQFTQALLEGIDFLVLKTYKVDIYYRFVTDVFFHPTLKDKDQVFKKGKFLNEEILNQGHAQLWMGF